MKPGDRVKQLRAVADELGSCSYTEIDIILRQFGVEPEYANTSDTHDYVLAQLDNAPDRNLVDLYEYVSNMGDEPATDLDLPWAARRFRLFFSHISADKVLVTDLKTALAEYGVDGFVAHEDIKPAGDWQDEIEKALETCDGLAAVLTPKFHTSNWTDQEVGYCIKRRVLILPLRFGATPYGLMGKYQGLQCSRVAIPGIAEKIVGTLLEQDLTKQSMAEALVGYFEDSPSYPEANRRFKLLLKVDVWTSELLRRLEQTAQHNDQVAGAWYLPAKVDLFVRSRSA